MVQIGSHPPQPHSLRDSDVGIHPGIVAENLTSACPRRQRLAPPRLRRAQSTRLRVRERIGRLIPNRDHAEGLCDPEILLEGRGDGFYIRLLVRLAKLDLFGIEDWILAPLRDAERRDLTEVIEARGERAPTLIARPRTYICGTVPTGRYTLALQASSELYSTFFALSLSGHGRLGASVRTG